MPSRHLVTSLQDPGSIPGASMNELTEELTCEQRLKKAQQALLVQIDRNAQARDSIVALRKKTKHQREDLDAARALITELQDALRLREQQHEAYVEGILDASASWIRTLIVEHAA